MSKRSLSGDELSSAIGAFCSRQVGVVEGSFMCQSVSQLDPTAPSIAYEDSTVGAVVAQLQKEKSGAIIIVKSSGEISGIFSERDCLTKLLPDFSQFKDRKILEFMTPNPVTEQPTATVAFCLNLMSNGGFRHLPIVDQQGFPVGLLSLKQIVDSIVSRFVSDALSL